MLISAEKIFSLTDLTSLNNTDTPEIIAKLCQKAVAAKQHVAAVCVYPQFVKQAKKLLAATPVNIATVVNFPEGNQPIESVTAMIRQAVEDGANEIDVVFPYQNYLSGHQEAACDFIRACKAAGGEAILLKVILETGVLKDAAIIREVSYQVCHAGADFLKTSTGKIAVGATLEAAQAMLEVIGKMQRPIGCKISGGIRTVEQASQYIELASQMMGSAWVTPKHFRIGASQLIEEAQHAR